MLKHFLLILASFSALSGYSQSIAGLNFKHLYDPQNEVDLSLKLVNGQNQLTVFYKLTKYGASTQTYRLDWLRFESFSERAGTPIVSSDSLATEGKLSFPASEKPWILMGRVTSEANGNTWKYIQVMDSKYPVNGWVEGSSGLVFKPYVVLGQEYVLHAADESKPVHVFFYKTDFPAATAPFEDRGSSDRFLFADSNFNATPGQKLIFKSKGLYLVQQDTISRDGYAFMAMNTAYPRLNKIEDIPDPLVYVSAAEEHKELVAAGSDKVKVDKVILDITGDKERAKNFMKSYFRRIELSDYYFSAFKEGWKTDRGMIYLVFGLPDEITRNGLTEVWYYKTFKERFTFAKSGSIYDPNNFLLQRSKKFQLLWFNTVDSWRKSRY